MPEILLNRESFEQLNSRFESVFSTANEAAGYAWSAEHNQCIPFMINTLKRSLDDKATSIRSVMNIIVASFSEVDDENRKKAQEITDVLINSETIPPELINEQDFIDWFNGVIPAYGTDDLDMRPNLSKPREVSETQYDYTVDADGNMVYDHPLELDEYLLHEQGKADERYQGTCGLCSVANILRMAGVNATEDQILEYAKSSNDCKPYWLSLLGGIDTLWIGYDASAYAGSTNSYQIEDLLEHYGVSASRHPQDIDYMAECVEQGRGIIIGVEAGEFYSPFGYSINGGHAVTVTSVKRDSEGNILGFYVCDSNYNQMQANSEHPSGRYSPPVVYYDVDHIRESLNPGDQMVVTDKPIR